MKYTTLTLGIFSLCLPFIVQAATCPAPSTSKPLQVTGRYLTDANCNNVMLRGVNLPPYKEGWQNDIAQVSNAVATTKSNTARLMWWTHIAGSPEPQTGTTYYTANDLDRAITAFSSKGILPIVSLHDLTGKNNASQFKNIITAFWTKTDIVNVIKKHQAHLVINIANEWGPNWFTNQGIDSKADVTNFINTYKTTISALRAKGINVPLMIDADQYGSNEGIFINKSYGQPVSNGQYLINTDPKHNLLFAVHTYEWKYDYNSNTAESIDPAPRLNNIANSKLPFVIGEMGNLMPDGQSFSGYADLLTKANNNGIGYFAWNWYNDGTDTTLSPYRMNITLNGQYHEGDGVTLPTNRNENPWGWDILNGEGYGINVAIPGTYPVIFK
jgi:mannan endo-1,4-beta-mannosidase